MLKRYLVRVMAHLVLHSGEPLLLLLLLLLHVYIKLMGGVWGGVDAVELVGEFVVAAVELAGEDSGYEPSMDFARVVAGCVPLGCHD